MSALLSRTIFVVLLFSFVSLATARLEPVAPPSIIAPDIDALLPDEFGVWRRIALSDAVLPQDVELGPGEAVSYRAYVDDLGRVVTLVAAYGPPLGDSVRLHRPESCYVAQGFTILARREELLLLNEQPRPVVHLSTQSPSRREAVSYWLRSGPAFTTGAAQSQWAAFFRRQPAPLDGALVRISTVLGRRPAFEVHTDFLEAFSASLTPEGRRVLLGEGGA